MRKKGTQYIHFLIALFFFFSTINVKGEGTEQLCPDSGDQLALYCNNLDYYHFARYDGSDENRLYIHIANPETEQVFLGFTHPHSDGHDPSSSRISGYFRIKDPSGTVVYGPQLLDAGNANISTWTQATNGPNEIVGTGGYDAFIFNPDGMAAGDYYVEFNTDATTYSATHLLIEYYDITVANEDPTPVAVDGRVYSKNWALFAPTIDNNPAGPYDVYDRPFNGSFHVLSEEGFVSKIDFDGANFQPAAFNISFNSTGTSNTGDIISDRKSLESTQSNSPELKIFLNDPDPNEYPSGSYGEYLSNSDYPTIIGCPATGYYVRVAVTAPGVVEILFDLDQASGAGKYDTGTEDRLLAYEVTPGTGESSPYIRDIPWDGKDGLGANVNTVVPVATEIAFSQGAYHIPVYDVEFNLNGFSTSIVRPTAPGSVKLYYDDTNITENGANPPETEGCTPGCHTWNAELYGDVNTINTYWFAKQEIEISDIDIVAPDCGCALSGTNIIGKVYTDADGNGLLGSGEDGTGLNNIDVNLYEDVNTDGQVDVGDTFISTDITAANGEYSFAINLDNTLNTSVSTSGDDAIEDANNSDAVTLTDQILSVETDFFVGLRFQSLSIPQGATINSAYIEFQANGNNASTAEFVIAGEAIDDAPTFTATNSDITNRDPSTNTIDWTSVESWTDGLLYQSPDITLIVQELVNRPGWASGNSMVFTIGDGFGIRHAHAFDGTGAAPKLVITYTALPKYYVLEMDLNDLPTDMVLTTDNVESSTFTISNQSDCANYFGIDMDEDGDGIGNAIDIDADNDGIPDAIEDGGTGFIPDEDADGDGILNYLDDDDLTTGFPAFVDTDMDNINDIYDMDLDGIPNYLDLDGDNDGIPDIIEAGGADTDNNGIVDVLTDTDNDGLMDTYDNNDTDGPDGDGTDMTTPSTSLLLDANADGTTDLGDNDGDGFFNFIDLDADNDGITDVVENASGDISADGTAGSLDGIVNNYTDGDTNGWNDSSNSSVQNSDGDAFSDYLDVDADNDGIPDYLESVCTTCPTATTPTGSDTDKDGVLDMFENRSNDNTTTGTNTGSTPNEDDNDGTAPVDYLDLDSDNDGAKDWSEGFDVNKNGQALDDLILIAANYESAGSPTPNDYTTTDGDSDGIPDWMDNQPGTSGIDDNVKPPFLDPLSIYWVDENNNGLADLFDAVMGGTLAPVPNADGLDDSDWRDINSNPGLPVELARFTATEKDCKIIVYWKAITEDRFSHYELERSIDGVQFVKIAKHSASGEAHSREYSHPDDHPQALNYYRLKMVDLDGSFKYSEIVTAHVNCLDVSSMKVYPNPVSSSGTLHVKMHSEQQEAKIRITNNSGKVVKVLALGIERGWNSLQLNVSDLPQGIYFLANESDKELTPVKFVKIAE